MSTFLQIFFCSSPKLVRILRGAGAARPTWNSQDSELNKTRNLFLQALLSSACKNKNQGFIWFAILSGTAYLIVRQDNQVEKGETTLPQIKFSLGQPSIHFVNS